MVDGHGRDPAPVVDARVEESRIVGIGEVGRSLDVHPGAEHDPRCGHRRQELILGRLARIPHRRPRLGPKVLDDDLLDVAVSEMKLPDGEQRLGSLAKRLADADEDARGEGDRMPSGVLDGSKPDRRDLVRGAEMRTPFLGQPRRGGLEHDPHRRADVLEPGHVLPRHHSGVQVGQQAGVLDHLDGHGAKIVEGGRVAAGGEPLPRHRVALLGTVPQREQGLLTSLSTPGLRHGDDLLRGEEGPVELRRRFGERAVVAVIPAQHGERDENLPRVRDDVPVAEGPEVSGDGEQLIQGIAPGREQRFDFVDGERLAGPRPRQSAPEAVGEVRHRHRIYGRPRPVANTAR